MSVPMSLRGIACGAALAMVAVLLASCGDARPSLIAPPSTVLAPTVRPPTSPPSPSAPATAVEPRTTASPQSTPAASAATLGHPDLAAAHVAVEPVLSGLDRPLWVTNAGDGSGRLFVAEQAGRIRVVRDGVLQAKPFLDITDRVTSGGERGLLGVAFPPGFGAGRPVVYVHYSGANGATVISEFRLSPHDTDVLDPSSERVILTEPQPYANHNGGWIGFDGTGMLLVALGDGGSAGDPQNRASRLDTILGKILRIDVLGATAGKAYAIPSDNPFVGRADARPEILHFGLRNPFRDSIDPATGSLWIGDVGQNKWEEIDVAPAATRGLDFGWHRWEGRHCYEPAQGCDPAFVTPPVAEYGHDAGCAVIGGVVYRGAAIPALAGAYLFSDFCSGTLWGLDAALAADPPLRALPPPAVILAHTKAAISSIGTGEDGEVYLTDLAGGRLLRLVSGA